jgi:hypothetical protein
MFIPLLQISIFSIKDNKAMGEAIFRCVLAAVWFLASDWLYCYENKFYHKCKFDIKAIKTTSKSYSSHRAKYRFGAGTTTEVLEIIEVFGNQMVVADNLAFRMPVLFAHMVSESHAFHRPESAKDFCCNIHIFLAYIRYLLHKKALHFCAKEGMEMVKKTNEKTGRFATSSKPHEDYWYTHFTPRYTFSAAIVKEYEELRRRLSLYDLVYILLYGVAPFLKMQKGNSKGAYENCEKNNRDYNANRPKPGSFLPATKVPQPFYNALHKICHLECKIPVTPADLADLKTNMEEDSWKKGSLTTDGKYNHKPLGGDYLSGFSTGFLLERFLHISPDSSSVSSDRVKTIINRHYKDDKPDLFFTNEFDGDTPEVNSTQKAPAITTDSGDQPPKTKKRRVVAKVVAKASTSGNNRTSAEDLPTTTTTTKSTDKQERLWKRHIDDDNHDKEHKMIVKKRMKKDDFDKLSSAHKNQYRDAVSTDIFRVMEKSPDDDVMVGALIDACGTWNLSNHGELDSVPSVSNQRLRFTKIQNFLQKVATDVLGAKFSKSAKGFVLERPPESHLTSPGTSSPKSKTSQQRNTPIDASQQQDEDASQSIEEQELDPRRPVASSPQHADASQSPAKSTGTKENESVVSD